MLSFSPSYCLKMSHDLIFSIQRLRYAKKFHKIGFRSWKERVNKSFYELSFSFFICDFSPPTKLFVSQVSLHFNQIFAFFFFELLFFNFKRQKSFVTREEEETNKHLEMEICQVNSLTDKSSKVESLTAKSLTSTDSTTMP